MENEPNNKSHKVDNRRPPKENDNTESSQQLLPDFDAFDNSVTENDKTDNIDKTEVVDNLSLLTELGLADINDFGDFQNGMEDFGSNNPQNTVDDVFEKLLNDL